MTYRLYQSITCLALMRNMETDSNRPITSRTRQSLMGARQRQERRHMSMVKRRICYTCRLKGHLSQDCLKGNKFESKVVNSTTNVCGKTNIGYNARKMISSPCTSPKVIWVPKFLFTNLEGPNKTWVPKLA
jgi:hypothetical protein